MTLDDLNAAPAADAVRELQACCGSLRWATAMAGRRPFAGVSGLHRAADEVWWSLDGSDWLEAFSHHPRIGERAAGWARDEQAGTRGAAPETLKRLADLNHEYERRFGHVYLVCATGRSAADMLGDLEARLPNEPATELRIAAGEQAKITRLRLDKLVGARAAEVR